MGLKTGGPVSVHISHCTHVKSHLTLRKRVGPCGRWWLMTVHQYTREGNLLKPTKMCSLENGLWLLRYAFLLQFVCLCVCLFVCVCVCEQNSSRTNAPIWMRFSLNICLLHWLGPYWNWWPLVKGQGHSGAISILHNSLLTSLLCISPIKMIFGMPFRYAL